MLRRETVGTFGPFANYPFTSKMTRKHRKALVHLITDQSCLTDEQQLDLHQSHAPSVSGKRFSLLVEPLGVDQSPVPSADHHNSPLPVPEDASNMPAPVSKEYLQELFTQLDSQLI